MSDKHDRLLGLLVASDGWVTAAQLADHLGVSTRSVRSYVTAVKAGAAPLEVIASSTSGYRLNRDVYAGFLAGRPSRLADAESPRDRAYHVLRRLSDAPLGVDIFALADSMYVSESTIESDLRRLKGELAGSGLSLVRDGATVRITGTEYDLRRVLSRLFRDEGAQGFLALESIEREFSSSNLRAFKTDLIALLDSHGYVVNEYGLNNVLLHVAIAVDRAKNSLPSVEAASGDSAATPAGLTAGVGDLVDTHYGVRLVDGDVDYLALLLTTRVITRGAMGADAAGTREVPELAIVQRIVARVSEEYLVDLDDHDFALRLALHIGNLIARANDRSFSHNPLTRSIKTAYPMIYEVAVFIASEIQREARITVNDDEISYIALHVGSHLERESRRERRVTCALVCPNYHNMHVLLRQRLEAALGDELEVDIVITRTDVDWSELRADLVLTTIPASASFADNVVVVQPFLTEGDVEAVRRSIGRVRRQRRRIRLKEDLLQFFDASLSLREFHMSDEPSMIRALGERMQAAGVIDADYIDGAIERERMSSTAFTDTLAVPHALAMTARRTAICIAVNELSMPWGENRVNVIALVAFSASDRSSFQSVFDQFVSVFADRDEVQRLVRGSVDFPSFIDGLIHGIDK
ncbi:MAG: BglG family transcription antiterminator [Burkholderiaceae bacterium]|nr:BglG family transcription antiterminator [Microbacteriaceae bacterium]